MQVEIVSFQARTSPGLQTITSPQLGTAVPAAALAYICGAVTPLGMQFNHARLAVGATDGVRQWSAGGRSQNGVSTSNTHRHQSSTAILELLRPDVDTIEVRALFDAFVPGGIRLNWTATTTRDYTCFVVLFAGADVQAHAGQVVLGAQDVPLDVTAPGFKPRVIIGASDNHVDGLLAGWRGTYGVATLDALETGYIQKGAGWEHHNGLATTSIHRSVQTIRVGIQAITSGPAYTIELENPDALGFSVTVRDAASESDTWNYLALDFNGDAAVFDYDSPTTVGNDAVTGLGFMPQSVLIATNNLTTRDNIKSGGQVAPFAVHGFTPDAEISLAVVDQDNSAGSDAESLANARAIVNYKNSTNATQFEADFVSMDADGFTLNYTKINATVRRWFGIAFGPDLVTNDRRAQLSFAEVEFPDVKIVGRAQLSFAAVEVPNVPVLGDPVPESFSGPPTINLDLLIEELDAVSLKPISVDLAGYIARGDGILFDTFDGAAIPGEVRLSYPFALTPDDRVAIQAVLDAHKWLELTAHQASDAQDTADTAVLADYFQRWKNLTAAEKDDAARITTRLAVRSRTKDTRMVNATARIFWIELEVP